MAKRMLDCVTSDFVTFKKEDWLSSISGSEGRVIACESIGTVLPMLGNITNAEFTASMEQTFYCSTSLMCRIR